MKKIRNVGSLISLSAILSLAGCTGTSVLDYEDSAGADNYSPNYTYVNVVSEDGRSKDVLVPESCLPGEQSAETDKRGEAQVPSGCANNYNLQRMVEKQDDLIKGRRISPAPAAPAARAAKKYIEGQQPGAGGYNSISRPSRSGGANETEENY